MGVQLLSFTPGSFFHLLHPTLNSFSWAIVIIFDLIFTSHIYNSLQLFKSHIYTYFQTNYISSTLNCRMFKRKIALWSRLGHLSPLLAVHLLAVVSVDVEWCPNPLKAHVGTVCISFSHLGERPQPSLFTGIPCPLSLQPQPTALA